MDNNITINELVSKALAILQEGGLSEISIKFCKEETFKPIQQFYAKHRVITYGSRIMEEYHSFIRTRLSSGNIGEKHFHALELGVNRLTELVQSGQISLQPRKRGAAIQISSEYERVLADYAQTMKCRESTIAGNAAIIRRYFAFLSNLGRQEITDIQITDLKCFVTESMEWYGSKRHLLSALRGFHKFAAAKHLLAFDYESALCAPAVPHKKVMPCFSQEEMRHLFLSIDTETSDGKRDYAILLLAANTGLRTIDIANLKLGDIDWSEREISITQRKTGYPLALPISDEVIHALDEYIQNGRPAPSQEHIFLRNYAPYQPFRDGHAIGSMFRRRMKAAGLSKENGDGRSVHALRRTIGTRMAEAEVPLTTITQVLGHRSVNSAKRYLSLDCTHLKKCALGLSGISVSRKELM
jgi:integrase